MKTAGSARKLGHVLTALMLVALLVSTFGAGLVTAQPPWYVDDNTCPATGDGSAGNPFCKIQDAINAASDGDTVNVAAGTYDENLNVDNTKDNLTLQGEDKATTTVNVTGSYGVQIHADNVTFDGFTVKQNNAGVVQKALGLMNGATGCTVSHSVFDGTGSTKSGSMGILVRDSNNKIDGVESFGWTGYGIDVYSGGPPYADNVVIKNSEFHDNGWYNVAVDRSTNVQVVDCVLTGGGTGIAFFEAGGAPVTGGKVMGCTIRGATYDGVRLVGSDVLVDSNEISGCSTTTNPLPQNYGAVRVTTNTWPYYAADNNTITRNHIHDNLGNGILMDYGTYPEPAGNVFHCNNIVDNAVMGFDASTLTSDVDAEHNWWGDASGPSGQGAGSGDPVSTNVDFDPWLPKPFEEVGVCPPPANQDPDCSAATADPDSLWPPNHKFVAVEVGGVTDPDGDPVTITFDSIFQDEPVDETGDGSFTPDGLISLDGSTAEVRAERDGGGNGRVYAIGFTADDGNGGTCSGTVAVGVSKSIKRPAGDDGPTYDSTLP